MTSSLLRRDHDKVRIKHHIPAEAVVLQLRLQQRPKLGKLRRGQQRRFGNPLLSGPLHDPGYQVGHPGIFRHRLRARLLCRRPGPQRLGVGVENRLAGCRRSAPSSPLPSAGAQTPPQTTGSPPPPAARSSIACAGSCLKAPSPCCPPRTVRKVGRGCMPSLATQCSVPCPSSVGASPLARIFTGLTLPHHPDTPLVLPSHASNSGGDYWSFRRSTVTELAGKV